MKYLTKSEQLNRLVKYQRYLKRTTIKLTEDTEEIMNEGCLEGRWNTRDYIELRLRRTMTYLKELEEFIALIIKESK